MGCIGDTGGRLQICNIFYDYRLTLNDNHSQTENAIKGNRGVLTLDDALI